MAKPNFKRYDTTGLLLYAENILLKMTQNADGIPQFDEVFNRHEECKVDMVSFDRDLDDFKGVLSAIKRQEST